MLEGKQPIHFEKALFVSENAFYENAYSYEEFSLSVEAHAYLIQQLIETNNRSENLDFSTKIDFQQKIDITTLVYTKEEKKDLYRKALANWAIFTYMTDTTYFYGFQHLPFGYQFNDPFGMNDWRNSQVLHLLFGNTRKANCFALTALFKILSDRLYAGARICTAPQHIYIQHQDHKGDWYNVELATATHPGDGTIQTLTYSYKEAILNDIALRHLNDTQAVALCLINLGKSYEHKNLIKAADFMLQCAELALQYDSNSLNAMLLKEQALEEKVIQYAEKHNISNIELLQKDKNIASIWTQLEKQIVRLYELGYRQMPLDMQKIILNGIKKNENTTLIVKNQTPNPFPSLNNVALEDKRYSTLSRGLFEEVHTPKPFEQYGRLLLDTKQKKLVKIVSKNNFNFLIDPVVFAWQIDPLANKYPQWSPYAAFADNPILFIDPDGRDVTKSEAFKNSRNREAAFNTFILTTHAQNLLNKFASASGDYTTTTPGILSQHNLHFDTKVGDALGLTTLKIEINGKFKVYNPKKHARFVNKDTKFQIQVNLFNEKNAGAAAAILNHEAFVFAEEYANAMESFQKGEISQEEFIRRLNNLDQVTGIEQAYKKVLDPNSTYTAAQKELIQTLKDKGRMKDAEAAQDIYETDQQQVKEDYEVV
jgi:hypothetical protein